MNNNIVRNFIILFLFILPITFAQPEAKVNWKEAKSILKRIVPPTFPNNDFLLTKYGAVGDGVTDCTSAIKNAIDDCNKSGGGRVIVPEGSFLTGAIHLKSNVNLYVSENAVLKFTDDKSKYLPVVFTRWEGVECMNYSALIYAYEQENIAVTGKGILDGQGSDGNWWNWKGKNSKSVKGETQNEARKKLFEMSENSVQPEERIFGEGHYLRPNFFQPYRCKNILLEGVTMKNSPMWFIHPVLSSNISIVGVTVEGLGPNNDGCDPESCKDVLIKDCAFNTGDDCIAIKSGRNADGRRINIPSENFVIQNCSMKEGHGGVVIGSEISGGVRNIFAENCTMDSPHLDRAIRIKTNAVRGGTIENIFVRNIKVGQVGEAVILIDYFYEEADKGNFTPIVRNINIKNVTSQKSKYAVWVKAFTNSPLKNVKIENCSFNNVDQPNFIENVEALKFRNVSVNGKIVKD
ncbi:MAG: glycoside hydrolase [Ignavibacteria bacterium CG22_combo_CG10-13_8_21_14_all_37_15]|nr:MAG: glycoside hydrolase [Ignavibacteria bacterium CG22_combo_CG10-13_8_21_14_all_37_15]